MKIILNSHRPWIPTEKWLKGNGLQKGLGCFGSQELFKLFGYYKEKYLIATSACELCQITVKRKNAPWIREALSWKTDMNMLIDREDVKDIKVITSSDNSEDEKLMYHINKFKNVIEDNKENQKNATEEIELLLSNLVNLEVKLAVINQDATSDKDLEEADDKISVH